MYYDDQKMFEKFISLTPHKFNGAIGEDAYEFLTDF